MERFEKVIAYAVVILISLMGAGAFGMAGYVFDLYYRENTVLGAVFALIFLYLGVNLALTSVRLWKQLNHDYRQGA